VERLIPSACAALGRQARLKKERRAEREERERVHRERAAAGRARGCLVCRDADGGFERKEHPIPESVGNTGIVLPSGVVCDRCNGGVLSDLDKELCEFFPIKMRRTMLGINTKVGKVPTTRFGTGIVRNAGMQPNGQMGLVVEVNNANDNKTFHETSRVGQRVGLSLNAKGGRRLTARYCSEIARALLKCAFECAWIDHGEMMLERRFDHIRDAILGRPYAGFLAFVRKTDPNDTELRITYNFRDDEDGQAMWVLGSFYGVALFTDSRLAAPLGEDPENLASNIPFQPDDWRAAA
jgi:hypothetical protein